jgi:aldehyde dehydrogenase (NAD+)
MFTQQLQSQHDFFHQDITKDLNYRKIQLRNLKRAILDKESLINEALKQDLNKSEFEAFTTEVGFCLVSIDDALKRLNQWAKPHRVPTPLFNFYSKSWIKAEPLGTILIIGPYNYPFQLVIEPLIGALAAGNTVMIKPSEHAVHTQDVLVDLIKSTFKPELVDIFTGDEKVTNALIHLPFDHIFFTGSTKVGKIVYQAASENLVPVTLDLGGKSPTIVEESADLRFAARRIAFGKFINAGQTCIAPDYVLVQSSIKDAFNEELKKVIHEMKLNQASFGRIIHERHFDRLRKLIDPEKVIYGNDSDKKHLYLSPTLIDRVLWDDPIMSEEIFGPLLPILSFDSIEEVIEMLRRKEKPLSLYLFTKNMNVEREIFSKISFGSGAINDTIMQISNRDLPFGGVGSSGMGSYHGYFSFKTFSHLKSVVKKSSLFDLDLVYPPYSKSTLKLVRKIMK